LITRPPVEDIQVSRYRAEYEALFARINDLVKEGEGEG
jgi:hypothetical protein